MIMLLVIITVATYDADRSQRAHKVGSSAGARGLAIRCIVVYIYIYIYTCICICVYIYIYTHVCSMCTICRYVIYIYIERERYVMRVVHIQREIHIDRYITTALDI